ncbi:uncharacterized protein LOC144706015 [Wolffia australiana]
MGEDELASDFAGKLSKVFTQLRTMGEKLEERDVVAKLLRATLAKFDSITSSIEQFGEMESMTLEEAVGSHKIHEGKLKDRQSRRDEQVLLARAIRKGKKKDEDENSRGRGCGRGRSKGRGRGRSSDGKGWRKGDDFRYQDNSKIKCYNCEKFGHFAYECRSHRKEEKANLANAEKGESTLLITVTKPLDHALLHGSEGDPPMPDIWYLNMGANNHMTGSMMNKAARLWRSMKKSEALGAFTKVKESEEGEKNVKVDEMLMEEADVPSSLHEEVSRHAMKEEMDSIEKN